jgi:saccharopine dehydrogenase-like NADP-dependent oxidoreductase
LANAERDGFILQVGDQSIESATAKTKKHFHSEVFAFNIENEHDRTTYISKADLVISLLPPALHILAAKDCLKFGKNLITASYISNELKQMEAEVLSKNLLFLCECGLDPGIDHMSAMEIIHRLKSDGYTLSAFSSYTGGLVAPESNDNPWGYKFSWNPRNVIVAGQGTARYIANGKYHYLPYNRLFKEIVRIEVDELGGFDGYANRDSLSYRQHYGLDNIPTLIRGTLRQEGYCSAWQIFVTLGMADDTFTVENSEQLTYAEFTEACLPQSAIGNNVTEKLLNYFELNQDSDEYKKIESTGIFSNEKINLKNATPAMILQQLLQSKWVLKEEDKDMIVMQHNFEFTKLNKQYKLDSTLVVIGDNNIQTAMAKTVGLPLGIIARKVVKNEVLSKGVVMPVDKNIYQPILDDLNEMGIRFKEKMKEL